MDNRSNGTEAKNVRIVFFAKARELSGVNQSKILVNGTLCYAQLIEQVIHQFGLESIRDTLILAVNEEFVERDAVLDLTERDEIAVIPPLSGGFLKKHVDKMEAAKDVVRLQHEKLRMDDIIDSVASPSCGAISTFIGTTRDNFEGKKVVKLEYEAYESMALKEMKNICDQVRSKWNVKHIAIYHRLGEVPVLEASVAIAVSSPHRQESLRAVEFTIDTLKAKVPVWKKEVYDSTESQWKENKECSWSNNGATVDSRKYCDRIEIDPSQVQIRANNEELNRRIESFIARKRQQVNAVNVQEFCSHRYLSDESEGSCARVDAILIRRKDSKSHVKVHRVLNSRGPQTMDPLMLFAETNKSFSRDASESHREYPALDERLSITEKFLGISKPVPKDIYERIKSIENRILHLESLSPEYKDFWTYSTAELDSKLLELEDRYAKKIK